MTNCTGYQRFGIFQQRITHSASTQNFPKNSHFLPPDTHIDVCVSGGKKRELYGKFCLGTKWKGNAVLKTWDAR